MKSIKVIPGTGVYEHLLVIPPTAEVWEQVMAIKEDFAIKYNSNFARSGKPHLTLANFIIQSEILEHRISDKLSQLSLEIAPFRITLQAYGCIPYDNIHIVNRVKNPVHQLVQSIEQYLGKLMTYDETNKSYLIPDPHITIGRKLTRGQYDKAWSEYHSKDLNMTFTADGLIWLKRPVNTKKYEIVKRIDFQKMVSLNELV